MFCKEPDVAEAAEKLEAMHTYAQKHDMVITESFTSEAEVLNAGEEYDVLLCCNETLLLPLSDIEIINIA